MKTLANKTHGFTLLEIMIVVSLIGMLAAIAIPNLVKARSQSQLNACVNNLRQIDDATQQWALEHGANPSSTVAFDDIQPYLKSSVLCPASSDTTFANNYSLSTVSNVPLCRIVGSHVLAHDTTQ